MMFVHAEAFSNSFVRIIRMVRVVRIIKPEKNSPLSRLSSSQQKMAHSAPFTNEFYLLPIYLYYKQDKNCCLNKIKFYLSRCLAIYQGHIHYSPEHKYYH